MKILLREYNEEQYVWVTAKYNGQHFVVNGECIEEYHIVSVMNDNRKNYVACSSCGKLFPKKGNKFAKHKEMAHGINPCLECKKLRRSELRKTPTRLIPHKNGTYTQVYNVDVELRCQYSLWSSYDIDSPALIEMCKYRNCKDAHGMEVTDTFTKYPGIFDDIITVDKILDNGYEKMLYRESYISEYRLSRELEIDATVNSLGIVDRFLIDGISDYGDVVFYSKRYNMVFGCNGNGRYVPYTHRRLQEITDYLAKLYE